MAASSSSSLAENHGIKKYQVFISFRGFDVRRGFLSHLSNALKAKQINAFTDSKLERGKDITGNLYQIIEESTLFIVIFSQNYPDSEWCLEELEKIHESMKQRKQTVVPVFYEVDPSNVQELTGNYAVQLQKRRDALVEISNLSGFDSKTFVNDAKLIEGIISAVYTILSEICPIISQEEGLFGIDSSIKDVERLLRLDLTSDVRMVGIWGMGGIGKTTIARKVFDKIRNNFDGLCFVANVRETLSRYGQEEVIKKMIREVLMDRDIRISSDCSVDYFIQRRLEQVKVLLVLDDVHTCVQLNPLLGISDSFFPGSRIIVTSRDSQVLRNVRMESDVYEAKQLKDEEALELLRWHAFGKNKPQGYENILQEVIRYADGIPLALIVLGSQLKHKEIRFWEEALKKVKSVSPLEIQKILRISLDILDWEEKNIFLDISCFFNRGSRYASEYILECCGFHASVGIDRLIDKSLLIDYEGCIGMHDLLEQMGHEIVAEEKESKGQQSRLWEADDIKDALTNNTGSGNVEAMQLSPYFDGEMDLIAEATQIHHCYCHPKIDINSEAFIHMHRLRYLDLVSKNIKCPKGLKFLPTSIKYLRWEYYPLKCLPPNYIADKLVVLMMHSSNLEEINWSKPLMNLKRISLRCSQSLIRISDLALAPNLEKLDLFECDNLVEIGSSLQNLNKLTFLSVANCKSLSRLPELPYSIKELDLVGSGLLQLPSIVVCLTHLKKLSLTSCTRLESLPSNISSLSYLENISLIGCCNLQTLPEDFGNFKSLKELNASYSGLIKLPQSIQNLQNLRKLNLFCCKDLQYLPALPPNLEFLYATFYRDEVSSSIMVDQYIWKMHSIPTKVSWLCVNGSQVPDWMMYRNECGSFVSLDLEALGNSVNFIFCVVFLSNRAHGLHDCSQFKAVLFISETEYRDDFFGHDERMEVDTAHTDSEEEESYVFLWNSNCDCNFVKEVSFQPAFAYCGGGRIIKCGVHPIFHNKNYRKRTHPDNDKDPNVDLDLRLSL